jgi:hypothetical protein
MYTGTKFCAAGEAAEAQAVGQMKRSISQQGIKMEWELIVHKEEKYIEIITQGIADQNGSLTMAKFITETMRNNKITKALIDHRNIAGISGNIIEIYERPKTFRLIGWILGVKIAEIIKPEHAEHFRFLETVCLNQGFRMSIFREKNEALKWLL